MFNIQEIPIEAIIIKDRAREELLNIPSLMNTITRDGLLYPLLLNEDNQLIDGERRYMALKELGHDKIPCRIIPGLTGESCYLIELVSNSERESYTWVEELNQKDRLHKYWKENNSTIEDSWGFRETAKKLNVSLGGLSTDLTLAAAIIAFPQLKTEATKAKAREAYKKMQQQAEAIVAINNLAPEEKKNLEVMMSGGKGIKIPKAKPIESISQQLNNALDIPDDKKIPQQTEDTSYQPFTPVTPEDISLPAFTYEVTKYEKFITKIPDNTIGFCEIDWPYAIDFNNTYGQTTNIKTTEEDWSWKQFSEASKFLLPILYKKLLNNSWVLCWTGKEHWTWLNEQAYDAGFDIQPFGVWTKLSGSCNSPSTNMISVFETFLLFRKGKPTFNVSSFKNAIECPTVPAQQRGHQWEKPIKLYNTFFSALGKPGSIFFSPFAGSGNSMIVAAQHGMTPFGCDIKQKYFFHFYKNYKNYLGKQGEK